MFGPNPNGLAGIGPGTFVGSYIFGRSSSSPIGETEPDEAKIDHCVGGL
jgi:hypothetical protein